jgi:UDP-glucose 4-epimerase
VKLVFASNKTVYGSGRPGALREDDPPNPESPYAASKLAAEQIVVGYVRTGVIGACILRYFNIAGATADGYGGPAILGSSPRPSERPAEKSRM